MMSDFYVLSAVREHLLGQKITPHIHLALPPLALYPLLLVEGQEMEPFYPFQEKEGRKNIQVRLKFKVGVYSRGPGVEEGVHLSGKLKEALEGATLSVPGKEGANKTVTIRFLTCVTVMPGTASQGQPLRLIHQFYESVVWG